MKFSLVRRKDKPTQLIVDLPANEEWNMLGSVKYQVVQLIADKWVEEHGDKFVDDLFKEGDVEKEVKSLIVKNLMKGGRM